MNYHSVTEFPVKLLFVDSSNKETNKGNLHVTNLTTNLKSSIWEHAYVSMKANHNHNKSWNSSKTILSFIHHVNKKYIIPMI